MKRIALLLALISLFVSPIKPEPWGGIILTMTTNTGVRIVGPNVMTIASSLTVQMTTGGTHVGYLLSAPPDVAACNKAAAGVTLIQELAAATASAPGTPVTIPFNPDPQGGIQIRNYCLQGTSSELVNVSYNIRN